MSKRAPDDLAPSSDEDDEEFQAQLERAVKRQKLAPEPEADTVGKPLNITNKFGEWFSVHGYSPEKLRVSTEGFYQIFLTKGGWTKPSRGSLKKDGYRDAMVDGKKYQAHFLLCTAFFGARPDESYTPQHGPGGRGDNSRANLKGWATKKEQRNEYQKPHRNYRDGKPILVWKVGTPKAKAEWYPSAGKAEKATGATSLAAVANGDRKTSGGFHAVWAPPPESQDDLSFEGYLPAQSLAEEWRKVNERLWVSSRGRAWQKNNRGNDWGYKHTPKPCEGESYVRIQINGKSKLFHRVVFEAFFPGVLGKRDVDHIDRNPVNNELRNLRAATRKENLENRELKPRTEIQNSRKKAVRGRPVNTLAWKLHKPSLSEAAEELAILLRKKTTQKGLSKAIHKPRPYKGWEFELVSEDE
jgi:hypothetical protein